MVSESMTAFSFGWILSASTAVGSCADTFSDSTMWRAIDWRGRDIFSVGPRRRAAAAGAWEGAGGVDRAAGACAAGVGAWVCVVGVCVGAAGCGGGVCL